jgi:hypothetical protein
MILAFMDRTDKNFIQVQKEINDMAVNFDGINAAVAAIKASIDAAVTQLDALETYIKANPNTDPAVTAALQAIQDTLTASNTELDTAVTNDVVPPPTV